ncbi:MAG: hypothetical protein GY772_01925, partial [bacterium]|nr:hypothetical protein [bacterium]
MTISRIRVASDGRLLVFPALPSGETFEFIYRAARGAQWDSEQGALYTEAPTT